MCPGSSDPFYIASLLYKMGHYFLDILYVRISGLKSWYPLPNIRIQQGRPDKLYFFGKTHLNPFKLVTFPKPRGIRGRANPRKRLERLIRVEKSILKPTSARSRAQKSSQFISFCAHATFILSLLLGATIFAFSTKPCLKYYSISCSIPFLNLVIS